MSQSWTSSFCNINKIKWKSHTKKIIVSSNMEELLLDHTNALLTWFAMVCIFSIIQMAPKLLLRKKKILLNLFVWGSIIKALKQPPSYAACGSFCIQFCIYNWKKLGLRSCDWHVHWRISLDINHCTQANTLCVIISLSVSLIHK